jgi:hypothetical protein
VDTKKEDLLMHANNLFRLPLMQSCRYTFRHPVFDVRNEEAEHDADTSEAQSGQKHSFEKR